MKFNEKQRQKICDYIERSLNDAKLNHLVIDDDSGDKLPLVDLLGIDSADITGGQSEITHIVEQIYFDMETWDI